MQTIGIVEIFLVIKEELGDDKIPAVIDFYFQVLGILCFVGTEDVSFRKTRNTDSEIIFEVFADKGAEVTAVFEVVFSGSPVRLILRRISPQGQDVLDPSLFDMVKDA